MVPVLGGCLFVFVFQTVDFFMRQIQVFFKVHKVAVFSAVSGENNFMKAERLDHPRDCRHFLDTRDRNSSTVGTETLCDLTMNSFTFNDKTLPTDIWYSHGNQNGAFLRQSVPHQI